MQRFLIMIAVTVLLGPGAPPVSADDASRRLATRFASLANLFVESENPPVQAIAMAILFAREGVVLEPDDPQSWRFLRDVAVLAERADLHREALDNIIRLDPLDDVSLLRRINLALEEMSTVEERVAACRRMLAPEKRAEIGSAVASRLAVDMAFLLRRSGDTDGFADALAEAVAIDPSNRTAAAIAAGFFRMNVDDPVAEAELLITFMQADPTNLTTQIGLARLLLEHGAYVGAARLYAVAAENMLSGLMRRPPDDLLADLATARWATGAHDAALRIIQERQQVHNEMARLILMRDDPGLGPLERVKIQGDLTPTLASVRAVVEASRGSASALERVDATLGTYEALIDKIDSLALPEGAAEQARLRLEAAWIAVWLGDDMDRVRALIEAAEAERPLVDAERSKLFGWIALREGDTQIALDMLSAIDDPDPATNLGLAHAYLALDRRQDGARALLAAARAQPGSLIGIWAANELAAVVNKRIPLSPVARDLEELIAQVPPTFDRYPSSPSLAVSFNLVPARPTMGPYEPIILNIEITNNSSYPLAIDRDGPVRPQVILLFSTSLPELGIADLPPMVVEIDHRLRLEPRETLVVPVNLRRYQLGEVLATNSVRGVFVRAKGILNVFTTPKNAFVPGLLGSEEWTEPMRVNGLRVVPSWIVAETSSSRDETRPDHLTRLAILGQAATIRLPQNARPEVFKLVSDASLAVTAAYGKLDPVSQAWFLTTIPSGYILPGIRSAARQSDDRRVKMAYVMFHLAGLDDPVLVAARESDDESLRFLAEGSTDIYTQILEMKQREAEAEEARR